MSLALESNQTTKKIPNQIKKISRKNDFPTFLFHTFVHFTDMYNHAKLDDSTYTQDDSTNRRTDGLMMES